MKLPKAEWDPEETEDWDRDIKVEQKLNRVRPFGLSAMPTPTVADLSTSFNSAMALHPYFHSNDVSASAPERKPAPRVDTTDNSYHNTREPRKPSMAFDGGSRGVGAGGVGGGRRRDDLTSTRSQNTTLDLSTDGRDSSFPHRPSSAYPSTRSQVSRSPTTIGSSLSNLAPTPPPAKPLGRGAISAAVRQAGQATRNPGYAANANRTADTVLETSRSSGFGVGLQAGERAGGLAARRTASRESSLERRPFGMISNNGFPADSSVDSRYSFPKMTSLGRGQSLSGY